jgi:hypothetical protein
VGRARRPSAWWIGLLLAAGSLLAVALLVQTIVNYRFVSTSLVRQQARRTAEDVVRSIERAVRLSRPEDAGAFRAVLEEIRADAPERIASIAVSQLDGEIVAAAGEATTLFTAEDRQRLLRGREIPLESGRGGGREVLAGVFLCRCSLPSARVERAGPARLVAEIAIYPDALTASFARLRRNAAISAGAALALLISVSLIALRLGAYVRGKQLDAQLEVARQVQADLLPSPGSWPSGVDLAAHCVPASQIGGDFYDVVPLSGGRLSFLLGDVSGHGVSAALLMSLIHGAMSSPPWGMAEGEPERGAERLNNLLLAKSSGERFASLFWCAYDPSSGQLRYLNAGHVPPLRFRKDADGSWTFDRLAHGGPVLGVLSSAAHHVAVEQAGDGELLVLYSDGIVEAVDRRDEPFGEDRLIAVVQGRAHETTRAISDAVLAAVRAFTEGRPAEDDRSLLVVRLWRTNTRST